MNNSFEINKYNLKLVDKVLEQGFLDSYFSDSLKSTRFALIFAIILFATFGIPDIINFKEEKIGVLIIRYYIYLPYMLGLLLFSFTKYFKRFWQFLYSITIFMAGLIVLMIAKLDAPDISIHFYGLIMVFIYCFSFSRLLFKYSAITSILLLFTYIIVAHDLVYIDGHNTMFISMIFLLIFYLAVVSNGIYSTYLLEKLNRENFIQKKEINEKNLLLSDAVQDLSEKNKLVSEQIIELDDLNKRLSEVNYEISKQFNELEFLHKDQKKLNEEILEKNNYLAQLNQELKEVNATKDKFFSIISHDLKNPIGAIRNYAELLRFYDKMDKEKQQDLTDSLNLSVNFVIDLLENLLTWSRSQTDRIQFAPEIFNINSEINSIIKLLSPSAENKRIFIDFSNDTSWDIFADKNMIQTVVRNLLSNAIKFTNLDGIIEIKSIADSKFYYLSIKDNGIGMRENQLANLFKLDIHHSEKGTNNELGTGLGLLLCKEFINKHEGKIWAESKINQGSTFTISIPIK